MSTASSTAGTPAPDIQPAAPSTAPAVDLSLEEAGALAPLVAPDAAARRVQAGAVLVDVRSDAGRATTGSIPGAHVVDRSSVAETFDLAGAARLAPVLSLDTPVVVVCGSVRGSGPVAAALRAQGFTDVVHVEGGAPGWAEAGLPIERSDEASA
ncbi:rhodanese-like domain-containing protein [Cellulomonas persica]|uniref:Rhodanese domain-containing protein n=1 Tax=Cellulomonas persica TaxID=76861 RepID=A0A510UT72_9CELL|nr:rhodanese-like domain-containing protein [Cellulomonas persica]GEK17877.1 hypothetical protein CPE01_16100 [Cellulomonas persica]